VKKTSVYLEPDLDQALARRAGERGISKAELIRVTLRESLAASRPRITAIAVGSGPGDVADDVDRYLAQGFGRE
jgi:hypothetical protein